MKRFTISKDKFLVWYFEDGQDTEIAHLRKEVADNVIKQLFEKQTATLTVRNLFEQVNQMAIKLQYLEEFKDRTDIELDSELGDYMEGKEGKDGYEVILLE